jgi:hypothetical protein
MKVRTCGNCKFRDFGTDSHYVCHNKNVQKEHNRKVVRVGINEIACFLFKKKESK